MLPLDLSGPEETPAVGVSRSRLQRKINSRFDAAGRFLDSAEAVLVSLRSITDLPLREQWGRGLSVYHVPLAESFINNVHLAGVVACSITRLEVGEWKFKDGNPEPSPTGRPLSFEDLAPHAYSQAARAVDRVRKTLATLKSTRDSINHIDERLSRRSNRGEIDWDGPLELGSVVYHEETPYYRTLGVDPHVKTPKGKSPQGVMLEIPLDISYIKLVEGTCLDVVNSFREEGRPPIEFSMNGPPWANHRR